MMLINKYKKIQHIQGKCKIAKKNSTVRCRALIKPRKSSKKIPNRPFFKI